MRFLQQEAKIKTMKRKVLCWLCLVVSLVITISCQDDDDNNSVLEDTVWIYMSSTPDSLAVGPTRGKAFVFGKDAYDIYNLDKNQKIVSSDYGIGPIKYTYKNGVIHTDYGTTIEIKKEGQYSFFYWDGDTYYLSGESKYDLLPKISRSLK